MHMFGINGEKNKKVTQVIQIHLGNGH